MLMPIGDVLMCQPALAGLRRRYPHARLTALVTRERAEIVRGNADIDALLVYDFTPTRGAQSRLDATLAEIYARRFDMVVSFSTAGNCVAIVSAIPRQVWQRLPFFFWLWGSRDRAYLNRHAIDHYWQVVAQLGIVPRGPADLVPQWSVSPADHALALARLRQLGIELCRRAAARAAAPWRRRILWQEALASAPFCRASGANLRRNWRSGHCDGRSG